MTKPPTSPYFNAKANPSSTTPSEELISDKTSNTVDPLLSDPYPYEETFDDDSNAAPLHLHVKTTGNKLQGTPSAHLMTRNSFGHNPRSRSSSRSRSSLSRDISPSSSDSNNSLTEITLIHQIGSTSPPHNTNQIHHHHPHIDPDILLDKLGLENELDLPQHHFHELLSNSHKSLPSLNERMSDESLDDCHAFTDLRNVIRQLPGVTGGTNTSTNSTSTLSALGSDGNTPVRSRDGSVHGGSILGDSSCLLETLEEFEEEEGDEDDDDDDKDQTGGSGVKPNYKKSESSLSD